MRPSEVIADYHSLDIMLNRQIHSKDQMFTGNKSYYFGCGYDAITKIAGILSTLGLNDEPEKILDFACGYGRVTRFIRAAFPMSHIVVSDVMAEAVDFCAETFSAEKIYLLMTLILFYLTNLI